MKKWCFFLFQICAIIAISKTRQQLKEKTENSDQEQKGTNSE